jgi:hypothetical protein
MTPRIPSSGLFESCCGITAAVALATWNGVGRSVIVDEAIVRSNQCLVRTVAITERPGRNVVAISESSNAIFTGILCTTFV